MKIESPDEDGIAIIGGTVLFIGSLVWCRLDPDTPLYFLLLLGCSGAWLISYPLFNRYFIVKGLIRQGFDHLSVKRQWKINLGIFKI